MKTLFRFFLATVVCMACLLVLQTAQEYFVAESLLGATVEQVMDVCFKVLAWVTVILYVWCVLGYIVDAIRDIVRRSKAKKNAVRSSSGVVLTISESDTPKLYDDAAQEAAAAAENTEEKESGHRPSREKNKKKHSKNGKKK
ncbi:MAG: hypothetical protein IJ412_06460 [Oscillospiraceae bacterium]|nr:hypothetical protein [Oscillospiraceae bacterium]